MSDAVPPPAEPTPAVERTPLLSRILAEVQEHPEATLSNATLVRWATRSALGNADVPLAPGVLDAIHSRMPDRENSWEKARAVVNDVAAGRLSDWRVVEERLRPIRVAPALKGFLDNLTPADVPPSVAETFWALARLSADEEPVKWGIVLGSIHPAPVQVPELLLFARHPEFTRYAVPALRMLAQGEGEIIGELLDLLSRTAGYATVHLARGLLQEEVIRNDLVAQETLLVEGMRRGIKGELAVPFAARLEVGELAKRAQEAEPVFEAFVMLVNAIVYDAGGSPVPQRLEALERVYRPYVALLQARPADVRVLSGLVTLREFLHTVPDDIGFADKEWRRAQIERLLEERNDPALLRAGVEQKPTRALALHVIDALRVSSFAPELAALFEREPDLLLADVLSKHGGPNELEKLRQLLPRLVDLEARRQAEMRHDSNLSAADPAHRLFAVVVRGMGRLATPDAVELLKRACRDPHPWGRAAACEGISFLPPSAHDDELRALVRERLTDSPDYVVAEARRAAATLGLEA